MTQGKWVRACALLCAVSLPSIARAQMVAPAPVRQSVDANGVDLFLGTLNVAGPKVSMGAGDQGLSYYFLNIGAGWTDNLTAALNQSSTQVTVRLGATTDDFTAAGTTYTSIEGHGATLTVSGTTYTYTSSNGTVAHFTSSKANAAPYYASLGRATDITSPSGAKVVYAYDSVYYCTNAKPTLPDFCTTHGYAYRLSSVSNSYGYQITLNYPATDPADPSDTYWAANNLTNWSTPSGTVLRNAENASSPNLSLGTSSTASTFSVTDPAGRTTSYRQSGSQILGITRAGSSSENVTVAYSNNRVSSVTTAAGTWSYGAPSDVSGVRTVTVTDPSSQTTTYQFNIASQRMTGMTDPLGRATSWQYDTSGRLTLATAPELNSVQYFYDARGNATSTTLHPKPNSGQADITTSAGYDATCSNAVTCNSPNWTRDANGNQTNYSYDPTHGGLLTVTSPAPSSGGVQPQMRYSYSALTDYFGGTVYKLTGTSACRTQSSCANTGDEVVAAISYGSVSANNLLPMAITKRAGDNSVSATSSVGYDAVGNVTSITNPLGAATQIQYDADRWPVLTVGPDPDGGGPLRNRAVRTNYNPDGTVASAETGTANADGSGFGSLQQVATAYDGAQRKVQETVTAGATTYAVTQFAYDPANRATCTAQRMNPAAFGSLPGACTLGAQGSFGPDRIMRTHYDELGRVDQTTSAYGTSDQADDARASYTPNGKTASATDANGNVTSYVYDGFDRLTQTHYPNPSGGGSSTYDSANLEYDSAGNVTRRWLRGTGNHQDYGYDALKRLVSVSVPHLNASDHNISYTYDNLGELTYANEDSGRFASFGYDALGRKVSQGSVAGGTKTMQYDAAGRRTRLTWQDGFFVTYGYDAVGEMTGIWENGANILVSFSYDDLGRRTGLGRANGTSTSYGYDAASRLTSLNLNGGPANSLGFGYSPAGQITSRTSSNDAFAWTGAVNTDRAYAANGLNQYTQSGSVAPTYDPHGNLTQAGGATYGYDSFNRMGTYDNNWLYYDAAGALEWINTSGTRLDYDGTRLITEMDGNNTISRRYVFGPGSDEALVWYEGSGTNDRRFLHADERGSIVAVTNNAGNALAVNTYDEYGIPGSGNLGRFQYTGQKWIAELGMYHYKARMYSPTLGRFMQTDPIGYGDGMNWYNYVGSDPVNATDPGGTEMAWEFDRWMWSCYGNCGGIGSGYWNWGSPWHGSGGGGSGAGSGGTSTPGAAPQPAGSAIAPSGGGGQLPSVSNGWGEATVTGVRPIDVSLSDIGWQRQNGTLNPMTAWTRAVAIGEQELARSRKLAGPHGGHNDIYDAERHARWTYRMTMEIGAGWADLFSGLREDVEEMPPELQPSREYFMDNHNNLLGINAALNGQPIPNSHTPGLIYIRPDGGYYAQ